MAKNRQNADFIVSTVRLHAVHIPEQSKRIIHAAQQQRAVHNRTVEHLLNHQSDEPLQKSTANGITGLFGRWPDWKTENEAAADTPSLVARGAISAARDQVAKWETTNLEHAVLIAKAQINDEPIPRRVQHRTNAETRTGSCEAGNAKNAKAATAYASTRTCGESTAEPSRSRASENSGPRTTSPRTSTSAPASSWNGHQEPG